MVALLSMLQKKINFEKKAFTQSEMSTLMKTRAECNING